MRGAAPGEPSARVNMGEQNQEALHEYAARTQVLSFADLAMASEQDTQIATPNDICGSSEEGWNGEEDDYGSDEFEEVEATTSTNSGEGDQVGKGHSSDNVSKTGNRFKVQGCSLRVAGHSEQHNWDPNVSEGNEKDLLLKGDTLQVEDVYREEGRENEKDEIENPKNGRGQRAGNMIFPGGLGEDTSTSMRAHEVCDAAIARDIKQCSLREASHLPEKNREGELDQHLTSRERNGELLGKQSDLESNHSAEEEPRFEEGSCNHACSIETPATIMATATAAQGTSDALGDVGPPADTQGLSSGGEKSGKFLLNSTIMGKGSAQGREIESEGQRDYERRISPAGVWIEWSDEATVLD
ncbi:unnamed protein product, partial [Choristocarpus tenellus]